MYNKRLEEMSQWVDDGRRRCLHFDYHSPPPPPNTYRVADPNVAKKENRNAIQISLQRTTNPQRIGWVEFERITQRLKKGAFFCVSAVCTIFGKRHAKRDCSIKKYRIKTNVIPENICYRIHTMQSY